MRAHSITDVNELRGEIDGAIDRAADDAFNKKEWDKRIDIMTLGISIDQVLLGKALRMAQGDVNKLEKAAQDLTAEAKALPTAAQRLQAWGTLTGAAHAIADLLA